MEVRPTVYADPLSPASASLYYGINVIDGLRALPNGCMQTVCTSPPYYGLRNYDLPPAVWTDQPDCDHKWLKDACETCGGWRGHLGLEPTLAMYVAHLVAVFQEVRRVLRPDGTLWLNLGDSYNNRSVARPSSHQGGLGFDNESIDRSWADQTKLGLSRLSSSEGGLKEKDLMGVPWRVALALQDAGWYLRNDIVWAKGSCMPEAVKDRCTRDHEYVFLFAHPDSGGRYFYDAEAIAVPAKDPTGIKYQKGTYKKEREIAAAQGRAFDGPTRSHVGNNRVDGASLRYASGHGAKRNKRTVWRVNPSSYVGAHFATWPPKLVEPMVLAGTSAKGACGACGAPWDRLTSTESSYPTSPEGRGHPNRYGDTDNKASKGYQLPSIQATTTTLGWEASCDCEADVVPCKVLDPFSGSATTGWVAMQHGRSYVGLDLNGEYLDLALARLEGRAAPVEDDGDNPIFDLFG